MAYKKQKHGFTLVELLVGSVLLVLVSSALSYVFITHFKFFRDESSVIAVTEENKIALDEIINQTRESQSVTSTCTPCGSDTTGSDLLILQIWPLDVNGEPFDGGTNFDYIVYKRDITDNTQLRKIVYPHATSSRHSTNDVLASNVSSLIFTYNDPTPQNATEVTVRIKNSVDNGGKIQEVDSQSKAVLRNK